MTRRKNAGPIDTVINYIQDEITKKNVLPGDRLPSERKLSELLGVGRPHIRAALQKLDGNRRYGQLPLQRRNKRADPYTGRCGHPGYDHCGTGPGRNRPAFL